MIVQDKFHVSNTHEKVYVNYFFKSISHFFFNIC